MKEFFYLVIHAKFKKLFIESTHNTVIQVFRYVFVGGLATIFDWGILWVLYGKWGLLEYLSVAIAFLAGLLVNYLLSNQFVFKDASHVKDHFLKFSVYFTTGVIGLVLTELFMLLFDMYMGWNFMVAKIVTTAIVFVWNFGSKKAVLYRKSEKS